MPDGKFLRANALNRDTLAPYFAAGTAFEESGCMRINLRGGGVTVCPDKHGNPKLVIVHNMGPYGGNFGPWEPAISTPDGNTILEFPLQEKDLEDLFGETTKDKIKIHIGLAYA